MALGASSKPTPAVVDETKKGSNANYKDPLSFNTTLQKKGVMSFPFYPPLFSTQN
jgi:hypothetical protein